MHKRDGRKRLLSLNRKKEKRKRERKYGLIDRDHRSRDRISRLTFPWIELTNTKIAQPHPLIEPRFNAEGTRSKSTPTSLASEVPFFIRNRGSIGRASASVPLGERTNSHTSRGPDPDDETVLGPGQFDLRHFESEPTDRGRVLKRCDVGRVLRGPRGALHLAGYCCFMMDETGDYACGNQHASSRRASVWVLVNGATWTWCVGARGGVLRRRVGSQDNLVIPVFFRQPSSLTLAECPEKPIRGGVPVSIARARVLETFSKLSLRPSLHVLRNFDAKSRFGNFFLIKILDGRVSRFLFSFPPGFRMNNREIVS